MSVYNKETERQGVAMCATIVFAVDQLYLHGKGVDKHDGMAMEWFRRASDQGHPHAEYNLAIGHLKGVKTDLKPGEAHKLIHHAASKGVKQAHKVLTNVPYFDTI